jgi:hypothetical protein
MILCRTERFTDCGLLSPASHLHPSVGSRENHAPSEVSGVLQATLPAQLAYLKSTTA